MVLDLIKGKKFAKKDGTLVEVDQILKDNKLLCFYFSAHWCPPCRGFTPVLKDFYEEISGDGDLAMVFISSDKDEDAMSKYFAEHGDYYCLPFVERELKGQLTKLFGISGIPTLVVCKSDGTIVTKDGRSHVGAKPPAACKAAWLA